MNTATQQRKDFVISRTFDAPLELMWKAQTEAAHLAKWWGPKGFEFKVGKLDFRKGGVFHYGMTPPGGGGMMWGLITYVDIVPMKKLVTLVHFSDEKMGVARHPMAPTWPLKTISTMTLVEKNGKTTLTLTWAPYEATEEETKTFDAGHASMEGGFKGTWDQLEAYLAEVQK